MNDTRATGAELLAPGDVAPDFTVNVTPDQTLSQRHNGPFDFEFLVAAMEAATKAA